MKIFFTPSANIFDHDTDVVDSNPLQYRVFNLSIPNGQYWGIIPTADSLNDPHFHSINPQLCYTVSRCNKTHNHTTSHHPKQPDRVIVSVRNWEGDEILNLDWPTTFLSHLPHSYGQLKAGSAVLLSPPSPSLSPPPSEDEIDRVLMTYRVTVADAPPLPPSSANTQIIPTGDVPIDVLVGAVAVEGENSTAHSNRPRVHAPPSPLPYNALDLTGLVEDDSLLFDSTDGLGGMDLLLDSLGDFVGEVNGEEEERGRLPRDQTATLPDGSNWAEEDRASALYVASRHTTF